MFIQKPKGKYLELDESTQNMCKKMGFIVEYIVWDCTN